VTERPEPFGTVPMAIHFCQEGRAGRIPQSEALDYAEAELRLYQKILAARDAQVTANTEGLTSRNPTTTSARAARKVEVRTGTQRAAVLSDICAHDGATDFELSHRLRLLASSVRPRRLELAQGGYVVDSGTTRKHRGTAWTLWTPSAAGMAWFARNRAEEAA